MSFSVSALLRDERGMTVFEALVAIGIGLGILGVVFTVMNTTFNQTARINDRVEAVQRGRVTMEKITRQLRSQVCPSTTGAALTQANSNSLTFYSDLSGGTGNPERRTIAYDGTSDTLVQHRYVGTGTWPETTYPAPGSPTQTQRIAGDIVPVSSTPVFTYYAFDTSGTQTHRVLATPVPDADLPRVVRIGVTFVAQPSRTKQAPRSTTFQSAVDVRTADPNNPNETTRCL